MLATIAATLAAGALFLAPEHMRSLGALCVWAMPKIHSAPQWFRETLTSGGLAAILGAAMLYDDSSRVPGLAALPPALAAAAVMLGGDGAASRVLLQNPLSVFLGRISYSLCLVHWPVVVIYKYAVRDPFSAADIAIVLGLSAGLGWLPYRLVEIPFRRAGPRALAGEALAGRRLKATGALSELF